MDKDQKEKLSDILSKKLVDIPIEKAFLNNLTYRIVKDQHHSNPMDIYKSLSYTLRDRLAKKWLETQREHHIQDAKRVYYLSMEFLIGRLLKMNIDNLNLEKNVNKLMNKLNIDFNEIEEQEADAGLGNGGLGRLAACFLESMATLDIPSFGYGIRYDYGLFNQKIENGWQVEIPDPWLAKGYPFEIRRSDQYLISFYGNTKKTTDYNGHEKTEWVNCNHVYAVAYDIPVPGFLSGTVNTLRLWSAKSDDEFRLQIFNNGDFVRAYEEKIHDENISKVLYPNDNVYAGQELRLKQEYFFCSASLQDIIRRFKEKDGYDFTKLPEKVVIQLNDTHPAISIAELVRILVDIEGLTFSTAWEITKKTFAYTNHTLLPEALEKWPERMIANKLPRHLEIIYLINEELMKDIQSVFGANMYKMRAMSIIEEGPERKVRMANLAVTGSFSVNGVSALHTDLLKKEVLKDFYELFPEKFNNKTNGITPRRWLYKCNHRLGNLITSKIGADWIKDLNELKKLEHISDLEHLQDGWKIVKKNTKKEFSNWLDNKYGFYFDPESLVDVQVKRIHEYKRQLLNILHAIYLYLKIKDSPNGNHTPRTILFGGKAAPAYTAAKLQIKFINNVAKMINSDPQVNQILKVFFVPNYNVSVAEKIIPAADLSEQISTAGKEASGTGNMKFALNGALTIGTLDGANIEIMEEVGKDNIYIFGLKSHEVHDLLSNGYNPNTYIEAFEPLKKIINMIKNGFFNPEQRDLFYPIYQSLTSCDPYLNMADFKSYIDCQERVSLEFKDQDLWTKKSIANVARSGKFSSDRTIHEYNWDIWHATPIKISPHPEL